MNLFSILLLWLFALGVSQTLGLAVLFKVLLWAGALFVGAIGVGLVVCVVVALYLLIKKM